MTFFCILFRLFLTECFFKILLIDLLIALYATMYGKKSLTMFSSPTWRIMKLFQCGWNTFVFFSILIFTGLLVCLFKYENYPASQLKVHDTLLALSRELQSSVHFTVANLATLQKKCFSWERATPPPVKSSGCIGTLLVSFWVIVAELIFLTFFMIFSDAPFLLNCSLLVTSAGKKNAMRGSPSSEFSFTNQCWV